MYVVNVNGVAKSANSYTAAVSMVRESATSFATRLTNLSFPAVARLYRSPKTALRMLSNARAAAKNASAVKLPKTAGSYSGRAGGFSWAITKV